MCKLSQYHVTLMLLYLLTVNALTVLCNTYDVLGARDPDCASNIFFMWQTTFRN